MRALRKICLASWRTRISAYGSKNRKVDGENRSPSFFAPGGDPGIAEIEQTSGQSQTKATAFKIACEPGILLEKRLEQSGEKIAFHSNPAIFDFDADF